MYELKQALNRIESQNKLIQELLQQNQELNNKIKEMKKQPVIDNNHFVLDKEVYEKLLEKVLNSNAPVQTQQPTQLAHQIIKDFTSKKKQPKQPVTEVAPKEVETEQPETIKGMDALQSKINKLEGADEKEANEILKRLLKLQEIIDFNTKYNCHTIREDNNFEEELNKIKKLLGVPVEVSIGDKVYGAGNYVLSVTSKTPTKIANNVIDCRSDIITEESDTVKTLGKLGVDLLSGNITGVVGSIFDLMK